MSGQVKFSWRLTLRHHQAEHGSGEYYGGSIKDCMIGAMSHVIGDAQSVLARVGEKEGDLLVVSMEIAPWIG
jgi:hypothetical protein